MIPVRKKIEQIRKEYEEKLLFYPNVCGLGIGFKERKNVSLGRLCLKVYVEKKVPLSKLQKNEIIPKKLKGIETDVEEIGQVKAQ